MAMAPTEALAAPLPKLRDRAPRRVVMTPKASLPDLTTKYLRDDRVNHVIVGDELDHGVFVTAQKLLTGDIFGIEKYLPAGHAGALRAAARLRGPRHARSRRCSTSPRSRRCAARCAARSARSAKSC